MPARIAVVTGASAGIGRALAVRLVREGFEPLLVARRADKLEETAAAVRAAGGTPHILALDVTKPGAANAVLAAATKLGTPEALINNAGFGTYGAFADQDRAENMRMLDTNVRALTDLTAAFLPGMLARKSGYVMQVASTGAFQPLPYNATYAATKAYVLSFGEALAKELRGTGVSCTTLCPGPTESEFWEVGEFAKKGLAVPAAVLMPAAKCANLGVRGMMRRRSVVIAGLHNRAGALASRLTPHFLTNALVATFARPRPR